MELGDESQHWGDQVPSGTWSHIVVTIPHSYSHACWVLSFLETFWRSLPNCDAPVCIVVQEEREGVSPLTVDSLAQSPSRGITGNECVTEEGGGVDAWTVHQEDPEEGLEEGDGVNREGLQRMGVARPHGITMHEEYDFCPSAPIPVLTMEIGWVAPKEWAVYPLTNWSLAC